MSEDIGKFYKQLDDFKNKLVGLLTQLGKTSDINSSHKHYEKILFAKKTNVRLVIEMFHTHCVSKFHQEIRDKNDVYFLGRVDEVTSSAPRDKVSENDISLIVYIRDIWPDLPKDVKSNIWSFVQVLSILSDKIVGGKIFTR